MKNELDQRIRQTVRHRKLTEEEAARYRQIGAMVAEELPELRARGKARLQELRELAHVFVELKKVRQQQGLTLGDLQCLTGIDRSALSKLERGERINFTMDTVTRYAAALSKQGLFQLAHASKS